MGMACVAIGLVLLASSLFPADADIRQGLFDWGVGVSLTGLVLMVLPVMAVPTGIE